MKIWIGVHFPTFYSYSCSCIIHNSHRVTLIIIFHFVLGCEYNVCEGIEKALEKFKVKEKSKLEMKSSAAFRAAGKPEFNIPPNADVEYIVELNNFEKVSQDCRVFPN